MTNAETLQTIATAAREIARKHSFVYAGNFGRGEFTFEVGVRVSAEGVYLQSPCNAQITEKRAQAELTRIWNELKPIALAAAPKAKFAKSRGFKVWRMGFWHMSRFCTEGFGRGIVLG